MTYIHRASELGRCTKASILDRLDYEKSDPPEKMQVIFDRGNTHEGECIAVMREEGWVVTGEQETVWWVTNDVVVRGHLDGYTVSPHDEDTRVLEVKSPQSWEKFRQGYLTGNWSDNLAHRYAWQISVYMIATECEAVVACLEDGTIKWFVIEVPPYTENDVEIRVAHIEEMARLNAIPEKCTSADYPCPFWRFHEEPDLEVDVQLDSYVSDYTYWAEQEKQAKERKAAAQALVHAHIGDREKVETMGSLVSIYTQKGPTKWDEAAMVADGVPIEKYRKVGTPTERMKITKRETVQS